MMLVSLTWQPNPCILMRGKITHAHFHFFFNDVCLMRIVHVCFMSPSADNYNTRLRTVQATSSKTKVSRAIAKRIATAGNAPTAQIWTAPQWTTLTKQRYEGQALKRGSRSVRALVPEQKRDRPHSRHTARANIEQIKGTLNVNKWAFQAATWAGSS